MFDYDFPSDNVHFPYEEPNKKHIVLNVTNTNNLGSPITLVNSSDVKKNITIFFRFDEYKTNNPIFIDKNAKTINIYGFASKEGTDNYNFTLSHKRALNVKSKIKNLQKHQEIRIIPMGTNCKYNTRSSECRKVEIEYIY